MSYMENRYPASIVVDSIKTFVNLKQKKDENLIDYTRHFKSARDIMESHLGGKLHIPKLVEADDEYDATDRKKVKTCCERAYG